MTNQEFSSTALSFPHTEEKPHFNRQAFKVINKRIFATLHESSHIANIRLPLEDQSVFCDYGDSVYPVPNKWGQQGWTTFELSRLPKELVDDALYTAYTGVFKTRK